MITSHCNSSDAIQREWQAWPVYKCSTIHNTSLANTSAIKLMIPLVQRQQCSASMPAAFNAGTGILLEQLRKGSHPQARLSTSMWLKKLPPRPPFFA